MVVPPVSAPVRPLWQLVQLIGVVATVGLLAGLIWRPEPSLGLLWNVAIPLVPASLLVSPLLWRNACPLATLNQATNRFANGRRTGARFAVRAGAVGIALLLVLVPARRVLFNTDGPVLAATILLVAIAALVAGALLDMKAGFCNAFCPVLPVERLYGQSPLLRIGNARCATCTRCSSACIDLTPDRSISQLLGRSRRSSRWLTTPFGAFAAAFPGFVLAYFTAVDAPLSAAGSVYLRVGLLCAASYVLVFAAVRALELPATRVLPSLGAVAAGLYYWYAGPTVAEALGGGEAAGGLLRALALGLVGVWWLRAQRGNGPRRAAAPARTPSPDPGERRPAERGRRLPLL